MCQAFDGERGMVDMLERTYGRCVGCSGTIYCWCFNQTTPEKMVRKLAQRYSLAEVPELALKEQAKRLDHVQSGKFWGEVHMLADTIGPYLA